MSSNYRAIESVVRSLGLFGVSISTQQLICAVELAHQDPELLLYVTKGLYPAVAKRFEFTNGSAVERNLRTARDLVWSRGDTARLNDMAGYELKRRPTTGEFVDIIRYYMETNLLFTDCELTLR